ncbi:hypothetical protein C3941_12030 [Kaistia algarum]|nr:hypothetical protein C3941_12030 [Kaistia algarum]
MRSFFKLIARDLEQDRIEGQQEERGKSGADHDPIHHDEGHQPPRTPPATAALIVMAEIL